jgi:hypothetical protein
VRLAVPFDCEEPFMIRGLARARLMVLLAAVAAAHCQKPTDPSDTISYDEVINLAATPDPISADADTGGKTYRVVRGNNQPDEFLAYDWHMVFSASIQLTDEATDDDLNIDFPVRITATTLTVRQASGGIVTPPTGSESEKFEFITLNATGNQLPGTNQPVSLSYEVWYDLPSLRKEAVVSMAVSFVDNDGTTFQKTADFRVAP